MITPHITLCLVLILSTLTTSSAQDDDWKKVKEDQLTFAKYYATLNRLDTHLDNVKKFTYLMAKSSTKSQLQKRQIMDLRVFKSDSIATFQIPVQDLLKFRNHLSWESQHIGFPNMVTDLKGYGLVSQKQILELKLENLKLKQASKEEIANAQTELQQAEHNLNQFLQKRQRVD